MQHNLNHVRAASCLQRILAASLVMCMQQNPHISVSPTTTAETYCKFVLFPNDLLFLCSDCQC